MAHQSLKIRPGADTNLTPAFNEAGISSTNLIRFLPDPTGKGLAQTLGGWVAYYATPVATTTVRHIWPWADINSVNHIAIGSLGGPGQDSLSVLQNNAADVLSLYGITPATYDLSILNTSTVVTATAGSPLVLFNIPGSAVNGFDTIDIKTPISAGGLILFGQYPAIFEDGVNEFAIIATDVLGNASPALWSTGSVATTAATGDGSFATLTYTPAVGFFPVGATVTVDGVVPAGFNGVTIVTAATASSISYVSTATGPQTTAGTISTFAALPEFVVTAGSPTVNVLFPNHGYQVGSTFAALVPTTVGGITIFGEYQVTTIYDANYFAFNAATNATANATAFMNGNNIAITVYAGTGVLPTLLGYGDSGYGFAGYGGVLGTPVPPAATPITAEDWTFGNWGSILIACPLGGPIYFWDPTQTTVENPVAASIIPQAPAANLGIFIAMPQRQIVAWGSTTNGIVDPLLVRWCDVEDFTVWVGQPTNQAGEYRIPKGSAIVGGTQAPQQGILWTDLGVWAMQYTGQPFIYGFNELGTGCGLIGRKAFGLLGGEVLWMSQSQFFVLSGGSVQPLPCPVWDIAFQDLDRAHVNNIRCAPNSQFNEVSWFYPVLGGNGENTRYVKYNYVLQCWDFGILDRTSWSDQSIIGPPIGTGIDRILYQHEIGSTANGLPMPCSFTTGYFALNEADLKVFVDEMWPDMKWGLYNADTQAAQVNVSINVTDYPGKPPVTYGPFSFNACSTYMTPRLRGRLMSITIESAPSNISFWRLGNLRYRAMPDGKY